MARPWTDAGMMARALSQGVADAIEGAAKTSAVYLEGRIKRRLSGEVLRYRSGALRRSVRVEVGPHPDGIAITASAGGGPERVAYAAIHETGGVVTPRTAKYLAVPFLGGIRFVKQVTIPQRPYMRPSAEEAVKVFQRSLRDGLRAVGD